jgi:hypothetical protein
MMHFLSSIYTFSATGIWPGRPSAVIPWNGTSTQLMDIVKSQRQAGATQIALVLTYLTGKQLDRGNALCPSCPLTRHVLRRLTSRIQNSSDLNASITFLEINCSEFPDVCRSRRIKQFPFIEMLLISTSSDDLEFIAIPFTPKYDMSLYGFEVFFHRHLKTNPISSL